MGSGLVQQKMFTPGEILVGLLRYIQLAYPVKDFPPARNAAWEVLVIRIASDPEVSNFLSWDFDIPSVLDDVTMIDLATERIFVNVEDNYGRSLEACFPAAVRRMAEIAFQMEDFLEFS